MNEKVRKEYERWLQEPSLSENERNQLKAISSDEEAINDAFYRDLSFGTAGLRGVLGMGTNRMNIYVVMKATQGLANYLKKNFDKAAVAIAYDSRHFSPEFAQIAAKVLSSNGIKAYVYDVLKPTPVLSYTVRNLHCQAGIMVTASHNPAKYNGYKVYGDDGCQITDHFADMVSQEINKLDIFKDIKCDDDSLVESVPERVYQEFLASTMKKSLLDKSVNRDINIVFTPLNGTGRYPVQDILKMDGFNHVTLVKEQEEPDGDFTTCPYPNPEMKEALTLGVKLLQEVKGDVLIATDPDCDRIGLVSLDDKGLHYYSGNETGLLLFDYVYNTLKTRNLLPPQPVLVKTIVSTDLMNVICDKLGIQLFEVLTGFKYIGEVIANLEKVGRRDDFLLGFEESCGYLTNTDVRDKDAVNAAMLVAEMVAFNKANGKSVFERIEEIYEEYGRYSSVVNSYEFPGQSGKQKMDDFMKYFRENDIKFPVGEVKQRNDYLLSVAKGKNGEEEIKLPKSNVLKYIFEDGTSCTIRPSGTEPKIKFYLCGKDPKVLAALKEFLEGFFK
ncbi:MAG: phospho-sugar mutase [Bacilli bacterium]|nr:phospho-sugar mutase [Bacilli bacterium]